MKIELPQYPKLPKMKCDAGCTHCCTISGGTEQEFQAVMEYARKHGITPLRQGLKCPWYQDGRCAVYPVRPILCRIYGHFDDPMLTCPRGYNVNINPKEQRRIMRRTYTKESLAGGPRWLHEAVYTRPEIMAMKGPDLREIPKSVQGAFADILRPIAAKE